MSVRSVWHAGFTVADIEQSIAFWTEAVGMVLRHRQIQENAYTWSASRTCGCRSRSSGSRKEATARQVT
jgi:hypothetical protein